MTPQKPSNGRIVHFIPASKEDASGKHGQPYAAVVTHVWSDNCVNLGVIQDGSFPLVNLSPTSVSQSSDPDKPMPGTWQWPARA